MRCRSTLAALALALCLAASAQAEAQVVIVVPFEGPRAALAERRVRALLDDEGLEVIEATRLEATCRRTGALADSEAVARELGAQAIVDGHVSARRRRASVSVRVRDARTGSVLGDATPTAPTFSRALARLDGPALAAFVRSGLVPERVPTPTSEAPPDHAETLAAPSTPTPASPARPAALVVSFGVGVAGRELRYRDDLFDALSDHALPHAPLLRGAVRWYPGAHFVADALAHVGLSARVEGMPFVSTQPAQSSEEIDTEAWGFVLGLDLRLPLDPVEIGVGLGLGEQVFRAPGTGLLAVDYAFVRPSLRLAWTLGAGVTVDGALGLRLLVGSGEVAAWFPRSEGIGLDATLGATWMSDVGVGVRIAGDAEHHAFALRPEPGDARVAGGLHDLTLSGTAELVVSIR